MKTINKFICAFCLALIVLTLLSYKTTYAQGGPPCSTTLGASAGVGICVTRSIPSCYTEGNTGCSSCSSGTAADGRYYVITNNMSCAVDIDGIDIAFRQDTTSTKWRICHPQKNFATDCFTTEYGLSVLYGSPQSQAAGVCHPYNVVAGEEEFVSFVPPSAAPTGCGNSNDAHWRIMPGEHFSFVLYGADDGSKYGDDDAPLGDVAGVDITLTFKWIDGGGAHFFSQEYGNVGVSCGCNHHVSCDASHCP